MKEFLQNLVKALIEGTNVMQLIVDGSIASLTINDKDWGVTVAIYEYCLPIGYCLIIMYFCMAFSNVLKKGEITTEELTMMLLKLWIAEAVMTYAPNLISGMVDIGNLVVGDFKKLMDDTGMSKAIAQVVDEQNTLTLIVMVCVNLLPWLIAQIAYGIALFMVYLRKIELLGRIAFAPIGIADMFGDGRDNAIRYIKKIGAVALQGGGIMVGLFLTASLGANASLNMVTGGIVDETSMAQIIFAFLSVGAIGVSKTIINDALGV